MNTFTKITGTLALATVAAIGAAGSASAAPVLAPWFTHAEETELLLLLGGVNRDFRPGIEATSAEVCAILRSGEPVEDAYANVREAGYFPGFQEGYAVGVMVSVNCPELQYRLL